MEIERRSMMWESITKNPWTTVAGIATFIIGGLVYTGVLDQATAIALIAFLSGAGNVASKDGAK